MFDSIEDAQHAATYLAVMEPDNDGLTDSEMIDLILIKYGYGTLDYFFDRMTGYCSPIDMAQDDLEDRA